MTDPPERLPSLLLITPEYPPSGGGIGRFCARIVESAGAQGVAVEIIAPARREGRLGTILFLGSTVRRSVFAARSLRPDAVLCGHLELAPVGRFLRKLGLVRKTATIVHGTELFSSSLRKLRLGALRRQDLVLANSRYTREAAKEVGVPEDRLRVLHPSIPRGAILPGDRGRGRAALGIPDERPVALTVARMDPAQRHKGHDVLVEAWPGLRSAVPGATWVVAGDGADRGRIETLVDQRGLSEYVRFTGRVDEATLADLYAAADVFVMPSREIRRADGKRVLEGFGIVYLEAAFHGLPCIAGRAGGAVDAVVDGETGLLVDPDDPADVRGALERLLGHKTIAARMGAAGKARVLDEFDMSKNIRPVLKDLLGCA